MPSAPHGFLRVAAACPRVVVADPEANATEIVRLAGEASRAGAQVVVFPELSLTGYTAADLFFSLGTLVQGAERALLRLLRETAPQASVIAVGLPVALDGRLFNVAALCQGGRLLGLVPKTFLPNYGEYYEERWFSSSRDAVSDEATVAGQRVPFGSDLLFAVADEPGVVLAAEVCEDLWAPIPPSRPRTSSWPSRTTGASSYASIRAEPSRHTSTPTPACTSRPPTWSSAEGSWSRRTASFSPRASAFAGTATSS